MEVWHNLCAGGEGMTIQNNSAQALDLSAAVGPQIYRLLRKRIIRNTLNPGTRVSESEIALEYSVSRQPVREAFIKLAEEGLVEIRPQRGTFVCKIENQAVMDARFIREAIEKDIVRHLAENIDEDAIARLNREISEQRSAEADAARFMELDDRFHALLAEAAGKGRVWKTVEGLKSQMDRVRHLSLMQFPIPKLIGQHEAIVDAISKRDGEGAALAMRGHLREILDYLPGVAEANPGFFEKRS